MMVTKALPSSREGNESEHHRSWLRDNTMWLALGLSLATAFVVVARLTPNKSEPSASATITVPTTTPVSAAPPTSKLPGGLHGATPTPRLRHVTTTTSPQRSTTTTSPTLTTPGRTSSDTVAPGPTASTNPSSSITGVSEQWGGVLTYPNDVSSSYSFTTAGGTVSVRTVLARGAARLTSTLQCASAPQSIATDGALTTLRAGAGICTYDLEFVDASFHNGARASYAITAQYPALVPTS
jgi:hypothetical protein